jgi:hypothetical protein
LFSPNCFSNSSLISLTKVIFLTLVFEWYYWLIKKPKKKKGMCCSAHYLWKTSSEAHKLHNFLSFSRSRKLLFWVRSSASSEAGSKFHNCPLDLQLGRIVNFKWQHLPLDLITALNPFWFPCTKRTYGRGEGYYLAILK